MFVANCFYALLINTTLVQEDMSQFYLQLEPTPKKVLKSLRFPESMTPEEITRSSHFKKLVREMDDPEYLGLFLRFCTGSDVMPQNDIHVRFVAGNDTDYTRCPSTHTCGRVLEIPRSYSTDPYVVFKGDLCHLSNNRYWQMDFV